MVSYENKARIHLAIAIGALGMSLVVSIQGNPWAALPAMFSAGWSGAIAWMLKVRNMRHNGEDNRLSES